MRFRQVHLDFHTSECIDGIGKDFDKKQFQEALKAGHVDSITAGHIIHLKPTLPIRDLNLTY